MTDIPSPQPAPRPFTAVKAFADSVLAMLDERIKTADRGTHPFNDYFGDKPEAIVAAKAQASELREVRTQVRMLGDRALVDLMKFKPAIPAPEGAPDLRAAFESWALHTPPDERTNWEVYQAGARAGLAILDLRDDVIATLRGQIADLQALCDERGRRLYGDDGQAPAEGDGMLKPLIYAAMMHNGKPKTVAEFERAAANVADMLQRRAEVTHNKPVASIYISDDGSREFDDWRVDLPPGNHQLFTAPRPDQPQPESLPHPGAPEAEEMIEKLLAECNRPSNMKNAARAGYMAAKRLLQHARQPLPATDDAEPNVQPKGMQAGMVLAPAEPTKEMNRAGFYAHQATGLTGEIWRAMLAAAPAVQAPAPINMVLHCPACGLQHIDAPDERTKGWKNEPHRSHLCHGCGHIWRPADVPTNGVKAVQTKGKADSPIRSPAPAHAVQAPAPAEKVRAIAHQENGGWTVRIGSVAIGRWGYRGVVADREATGLANKVNAELDGKKVVAFGCESESFAPGKPSDCKWKGWCGGDNCPVSFEPAGVQAPAPALAVSCPNLIELAEALESRREPRPEHYINRAAAALRALTAPIAEDPDWEEQQIRDMARLFGFNEYAIGGRWERSTFTPDEIVAFAQALLSRRASAPCAAVAHQPETAMPADNTFNTAFLKLQEISAEAGAVKGYWPGDSDRIERVVKLANEVIEVLMQAPSGDFTHEEYIALTNPGALKPLEVGFGSQESQPPVQHKGGA